MQPAHSSGPGPLDSLPPDEPRRGFMKKAAAIVMGAVTGLVPLATGVLVFLDPLRSRKNKGVAAGEDENFLKVAALDGLLVGGAPRRYVVVDDRTDAWNLFPQEAIGAVYLIRPSLNEVRAFNVTCPHAGCAVDYQAERKVYQCPCHDSSFNPADGSIANASSPAARGLDELDVQIRNDQEVWVKFQNFHSGNAKKIPEA
jgi:menaquinol-cytochrome c reductase iron-sulfur subunit